MFLKTFWIPILAASLVCTLVVYTVEMIVRRYKPNERNFTNWERLFLLTWSYCFGLLFEFSQEP